MAAKNLKEKIQNLSSSAKSSSYEAVEYGKQKLANSRFMLDDIDEFEAFLDSSLPSEYVDGKSWQTKTFTHKVIVVFADIESDFFSKMLYQFPILMTKAFSQNISLKLADIHMKGLHKTSYSIKSGPSLILVENRKVIKVLEWEESIQKVVKSLNLDINKTIATL